MDAEEQMYLEELIDTHSLQIVLEEIAVICYEKADHVRTNWQDEKLAKTWEEVGRKLDDLSIGDL